MTFVNEHSKAEDKGNLATGWETFWIVLGVVSSALVMVGVIIAIILMSLPQLQGYFDEVAEQGILVEDLTK